MRLCWLFVLCLLLAGCTAETPPAVRQPDPTLSPQPTATPVGSPWIGRYTVTRQGPGQAHVGTLTIAHPGASFEAVWSFDEQYSPGVGLALGNTLVLSTGGRMCGVAIFEHVDATTWRGRRLDGATITSEQWIQVAVIDGVQGRYQVLGTGGTLVLAQRGPVVQLSGRITGPIEGVGLIRDGVLTAGTGGPGCGVVRYQRTGTGMDGEWTEYGSSTIASDSVTS